MRDDRTYHRRSESICRGEMLFRRNITELWYLFASARMCVLASEWYHVMLIRKWEVGSAKARKLLFQCCYVTDHRAHGNRRSPIHLIHISCILNALDLY